MTADSSVRRQKKVAGIILAAGCGSRMGKAKQLLPFGHTTLLGRVVTTARAAGLDAILLVLGFEAEQIRHALGLTCPNQTHPNQTHPNQTCPNQTCPGRIAIQVIDNPDWQKGQSFSVAAGLSALPPDMDGVLFLLGDQPLVTARTLHQLVSAFQITDYWILAPCFKGRRGNPVLVASPLFDRLRHPVGDAGARVLFEEFRCRMHCLEVDDPGILRDVDTPEDYADLVRERKGG
ncbi:MAG: nucleotidyltransferase family protein [Desulfotignum sp.]|nr:nucleotidyltransferase family protein [Desulfotignum sp.]